MIKFLSHPVFACSVPIVVIAYSKTLRKYHFLILQLCKLLKVEFLPMRFWIGMWVLVILLGVVAFEGCYLVDYFSRFTEEVVSVLISLLFIYEAVYFLVKVSKCIYLMSTERFKEVSLLEDAK